MSSTNMRNQEELNITMVGSNCPGKTSLVERYTRGIFTGEAVSTFESVFTKKTLIKGRERKMNILDVSSLYELQCSMESNWFKDCDGFALVYSVSDRSSFEVLGELRSLLVIVNGNKMPPVLVIGNKVDEERRVTTEEGMGFSKEFGYDFFETSVKKNLNVVEAFDRLVKKTYSYKFNETSSEMNCRCVMF